MDNSSTDFSVLAQQYRRRLAACRQLQAKSNFLRQRITQLRNTHDPRISAVVPVLNRQLRQLVDRIRQEDSGLAEEALAVGSEISKLHDERLERILRYRYLELMTWAEIVEITGFGLRWLHRLHRKGLEMIDG